VVLQIQRDLITFEARCFFGKVGLSCTGVTAVVGFTVRFSFLEKIILTIKYALNK